MQCTCVIYSEACSATLQTGLLTEWQLSCIKGLWCFESIITDYKNVSFNWVKEFTPNLLLHNNVYPPSRVDGLIWCRPMQMLYHLENQSLELNCCFSWTLISAACSQFYKQCHLLLDACGHFDGHLLGLTHDSSDCRPGALESVTCRAVYVSVEGLCHIYKRHLRFSHSESSSFYVLVCLFVFSPHETP